MKKVQITIQNLFKALEIDNEKYEETQITQEIIYIQTPTKELTPILGFVKKQKNNVYKYTLDNDETIKCSENHLVISDNIIPIKEAENILTCDGYRHIVRKDFLGIKDVYDISISTPHLYLTPNGIIHHNTSLTKIIVNNILKCEYLYINASEQNGVETVRGIITNFVQTRSFDGGIKVVILDEADSLTDVGGRGSSAQQALRGMMEEYSPYARFILTCNYPQKISEPIWSRVQAFYIQPERKDFIARCLTILKTENVTLTPEYKQQFLNLINDTYPDLRKCIGEMQKFSISGKFQPSVALNKEIEGISKGCYDMLIGKKDMFEIRKYIITNEQTFKADYNVLLKNLFECFYESNGDMIKKRTILLTIADAMESDSYVLDHEINFFATCIKIGNIIG